eukprot:m.95492 g.95492  ORF g.95492 m.95492 type:complete len:333 (+) comp13495_c0_seq1:315-1313(+)
MSANPFAGDDSDLEDDPDGSTMVDTEMLDALFQNARESNVGKDADPLSANDWMAQLEGMDSGDEEIGEEEGVVETQDSRENVNEARLSTVPSEHSQEAQDDDKDLIDNHENQEAPAIPPKKPEVATESNLESDENVPSQAASASESPKLPEKRNSNSEGEPPSRPARVQSLGTEFPELPPKPRSLSNASVMDPDKLRALDGATKPNRIKSPLSVSSDANDIAGRKHRRSMSMGDPRLILMNEKNMQRTNSDLLNAGSNMNDETPNFSHNFAPGMLPKDRVKMLQAAIQDYKERNKILEEQNKSLQFELVKVEEDRQFLERTLLRRSQRDSGS